MTLDASRKSVACARIAANPALTAALAVTVIAAATLAGAWFFQLVLDIRPCPLCLEQRYAYYLAVPLGAAGGARGRRRMPRGRCCWRASRCWLLAALGNAVARRLSRRRRMAFLPGPTDCTGPVGNLGSAGNLLERLDTVKVIRCDEVQWRFLGLSLAGYNVLISLLMAAIAAWGVVRTTRQPSLRHRTRV